MGADAKLRAHTDRVGRAAGCAVLGGRIVERGDGFKLRRAIGSAGAPSRKVMSSEWRRRVASPGLCSAATDPGCPAPVAQIVHRYPGQHRGFSGRSRRQECSTKLGRRARMSVWTTSATGSRCAPAVCSAATEPRLCHRPRPGWCGTPGVPARSCLRTPPVNHDTLCPILLSGVRGPSGTVPTACGQKPKGQPPQVQIRSGARQIAVRNGSETSGFRTGCAGRPLRLGGAVCDKVSPMRGTRPQACRYCAWRQQNRRLIGTSPWEAV